MVQRRNKRRVPREQLATAVRKNFNGAAVNETDVVVELVYKVRHQGKQDTNLDMFRFERINLTFPR